MQMEVTDWQKWCNFLPSVYFLHRFEKIQLNFFMADIAVNEQQQQHGDSSIIKSNINHPALGTVILEKSLKKP